MKQSNASKECLDRLQPQIVKNIEQNLMPRHIYKLLWPLAIAENYSAHRLVEKILKQHIFAKMRVDNYDNGGFTQRQFAGVDYMINFGHAWFNSEKTKKGQFGNLVYEQSKVKPWKLFEKQILRDLDDMLGAHAHSKPFIVAKTLHILTSSCVHRDQMNS